MTGFITRGQTLFVEAMRLTVAQAIFAEEFPAQAPDSYAIWVGSNYPMERTNTPGIWVTFQPSGDVQMAGLDNREFSPPGPSGDVRVFSRWRFGGTASFTVVTLNSLERARLLDGLTAMLAEVIQSPDGSVFRGHIEQNDLIELNVEWGSYSIGGWGEQPGTPWGTANEVMYEVTLTLGFEGSFLYDSNLTLMPLSAITLYADREGDDPEEPPGGPPWL